jgi:hypothetical protein
LRISRMRLAVPSARATVSCSTALRRTSRAPSAALAAAAPAPRSWATWMTVSPERSECAEFPTHPAHPVSSIPSLAAALPPSRLLFRGCLRPGGFVLPACGFDLVVLACLTFHVFSLLVPTASHWSACLVALCSCLRRGPLCHAFWTFWPLGRIL